MVHKYTDIEQNTPRLVVTFQRDGDNEMFGWGTIGNMPVFSLVGAMVRVASELPMLEPGDARHHCPEPALVLAWDEERRTVSWFVGKDVPTDPLVGMLEGIKLSIVMSHQAQQQARSARGLILGPNGAPIR